MFHSREQIDHVDRQISSAVEAGVAHCQAQDERFDGRAVQVRGRELINFASCSYLGLEADPRLIEAGVDAIRNHGVQLCSSRAYLESPFYQELDALFGEIFQANVLVTPTTTLGHMAAMPTLIDSDDAVILDHQVHASIQLASRTLTASGTHVELLRHNRMDLLEERVAKLSERYREVWYLADGIYSMFGDRSPNRELVEMLERHPSMRLYIDDAHGMSWCGPRGAGSVLEEIALHPRMILTTGLGKGFGTGGGLVILPDAEQHRRIRTCGPTMIFAGPLQPAILGAAAAGARIHLTDEIDALQAELRARMAHCDALLDHFSLPVPSSPLTPVGFVGVGSSRSAQAMTARLLEEGFFTNPAHFPATPMRKGGSRFLLTLHHSLDDIESLVTAIHRHWEGAVRAGGGTPEEVWKTFGLEMPEARRAPASQPSGALRLEVSDSIEKIDRTEWDAMLGDRGGLAWDALSLFERVFSEDRPVENQWTFRYYIVRDEESQPVLATCFSKALWKADLLADEQVSREVEERRNEDPLYLTQQVFGMGCLLAEGNHLWLREPSTSKTSEQALSLLLERVRSDAQRLGCDVRVLRDLPVADRELTTLIEADGMMPMSAPESMVIDDVGASEDELLASLRKKYRYHQRREVRPWNETYRCERIGVAGRPLAAGEAEHLHQLYLNVKTRNLELNTFELPVELLTEIGQAPAWEIVTLTPDSMPEAKPVGFFASFIGPSAYIPVVMGLEYPYVEEGGLYRQIIRRALIRAREAGRRRVLLGMGARLEKRRFGARPEMGRIFIEADDHYAFDAIEQITPDRA